jgi:hypothetical protein
MAMRLYPNPGYVVTLLLTAPIFVYLLSRNKTKTSNGLSEKAGFAMLFFLAIIMLLVNSNLGVSD